MAELKSPIELFLSLLTVHAERVLRTVRDILAGAALLAVVEKWRRGIFTNDDIAALVILSFVFGAAAAFVRQRSKQAGDRK
jgi:hypothetical protein